MELVCNIPDELYKKCKTSKFTLEEAVQFVDCVMKGIPLPPEHGRLKDVDRIDEERTDDNNPIIYLTINGEYIEAVSLNYLNDLPTLIPATKPKAESECGLDNYDCTACAHDGDSNICSECEDGSRYCKWR